MVIVFRLILYERRALDRWMGKWYRPMYFHFHSHTFVIYIDIKIFFPDRDGNKTGIVNLLSLPLDGSSQSPHTCNGCNEFQSNSNSQLLPSVLLAGTTVGSSSSIIFEFSELEAIPPSS